MKPTNFYGFQARNFAGFTLKSAHFRSFKTAFISWFHLAEGKVDLRAITEVAIQGFAAELIGGTLSLYFISRLRHYKPRCRFIEAEGFSYPVFWDNVVYTSRGKQLLSGFLGGMGGNMVVIAIKAVVDQNPRVVSLDWFVDAVIQEMIESGASEI